MSLIFATQLAAIATVVLAVFAIITAWYARKAFGKQADALKEQQAVNGKQLKVLTLQAEELSESLAERKREAVERRSVQAARVSIIQKPVFITPKHTDTGFRMDVTVVNANEPKQPVYDAKLWWYGRGEPSGTENPEIIGTILDEEHRSRTFYPGSDPDASGAILTFRDAARVSWIRTAGGDIMTGESELAFDLAKALYGGSELDALLPRE